MYLTGSIAIAILLQLMVLNVPVLQNAFRLTMPNAKGWLVVLAGGCIPLAFTELLKLFKRKQV